LRPVALALAVALAAASSPGVARAGAGPARAGPVPAGGVSDVTGAGARAIRLCADPANLPFSSEAPGPPGFEVEVARAIAAEAGLGFGVHWVPTVKERLVRRQLAEGRCDLLMGLPVSDRFAAERPDLAFSKPYTVLRQAIVTPAPGSIGALEGLRGKLVGVQAMTLSDQLVFQRGLNRKIYLSPSETFTALASGEVDAIVMESPLAGWFVKTSPGFRQAPVQAPDVEFRIGAAVRRDDRDLKALVDRAIERLQARTVPEILARYGIVQAAPGPAEAAGQDLRQGESLYTTQCSQCHGKDGRGTPVVADLLAFRGTETDFVRVVLNGRMGTAMTPWRGLLSEDEIRAIRAYLQRLAGAGTSR
jgi:polar amino acid transport system substrate-binding protein